VLLAGGVVLEDVIVESETCAQRQRVANERQVGVELEALLPEAVAGDRRREQRLRAGAAQRIVATPVGAGKRYPCAERPILMPVDRRMRLLGGVSWS
jgi:hypothetical protein